MRHYWNHKIDHGGVITSFTIAEVEVNKMYQLIIEKTDKPSEGTKPLEFNKKEIYLSKQELHHLVNAMRWIDV